MLYEVITVVGKGEDLLVVAVVVLDRHLDIDSLLLPLEEDRRITSYNVCYTKLLRFIGLSLAVVGGPCRP